MLYSVSFTRVKVIYQLESWWYVPRMLQSAFQSIFKQDFFFFLVPELFIVYSNAKNPKTVSVFQKN